MTHLDLFSGIGGFALAARWAGIETIAFAETDEYCSRVLTENFGAFMANPDGTRKPQPLRSVEELRRWAIHGSEEVGIPNYGDVRTVGAIYADIISAGVPCQPASCAGKRRGASDDRWLWPEAIAVVERCKPRWAVFENPCGILSLESGLEFERVLLALEGLGYEVWPVVVPACAVDARHRRDRVWIVAHAQRERWDRWGRGRQHETGTGPRDGAAGSSERSEHVADASGPGLEERQEQPARKERAPAERSGDTLPDAERGLRDGRTNVEGREPQERTALSRDSGRQFESRLGGVADGLSSGLDGPAMWPDEDPAVPRVKTKVQNRYHRLKALGNAVVPQLVYRILKGISEMEPSGAQQHQDDEPSIG